MYAELEREKYETVWNRPSYRVKSHSLDLWANHRNIFPDHIRSALDIGCGLGLLFQFLNDLGIDCHAVDIAENCLDDYIKDKYGDKFTVSPIWDYIRPIKDRFEIGVCTDVMEHIPREMVERTLTAIIASCEITYFKIANYPSHSAGYDLHLVQENCAWWVNALESVGGRAEVLNIRSDREEYFIKWICG